MTFQPAQNEVVLSIPDRQAWWHFRQPGEVIAAQHPEEVMAALEAVERRVREQGRYAAGFVSYEAAPAMDPALQVRPAAGTFPLLWFGIYDRPQALTKDQLLPAAPRLLDGPWQPTVNIPDYTKAIEEIKAHIARGDTYQVNFTYRLRTQEGSLGWPNAWALFSTLAGAHAAPYAAYVESTDWAVCSISPELFFTLDGETLTSRPMKGTAPRGRTLAEDQQQADWLHHSEKNRAENLMILDMVRNDLGRIARVGSVRVPAIFAVEKYPTVWQMTSTVQAETEASLPEIFQNLFPAASITGAPKVRTMEIIRALERTPRQIYTGAIGFYGPGRQAQFNVAIRTLLVDQRERSAEYGVGGGIVWDSQPEDEWQETRTKARILSEQPEPFSLLETLRWTPEEGWFLLEEHLARLARSAEYFAYPLDPDQLRAALAQRAAGFDPAQPQRVRLLLARDGQLALQAQPLPGGGNPRRVALAAGPVQSGDRFLYHKTTRRGVYETARAGRPGFDDVLLWNERGELTESTIANLVVVLDGQRVTPPVESGLLPGTYRAWLLEQGALVEQTVRVEDLDRCEGVFLINAVRGMWEVTVER